MQVSFILTFIVFILSFLVSVFIVVYKNKIKEIQTLIPLLFILFFGMYVIPFGINCTFNQDIGKEVYANLSQFQESIPYSFVLSSVFLLLFALLYRFVDFRFFKKPNDAVTLLSPIEKYILLGLFVCSIVLLEILGKDIGGIKGLVLRGYSVTELFIGKGHLANAFGWICSIVLLFCANAFVQKNRTKANIWIFVFILLCLFFAIMGRRSVITCIYIAVLFLYHYLYKNIGIIRLGILLVVLFYSLNMIGLLRRSDYTNLKEVAETMLPIEYDKKEVVPVEPEITPIEPEIVPVEPGITPIEPEIAPVKPKKKDIKWADRIYVFTTGQFAQPYQTFPHIIELHGKNYTYGYGKYHLQQFALIIPNALWEERPLTFAQDYAKNYRNVEKLNQGVLFFALAAGYMDFGWVGIILYSILITIIIKFLVSLFLAYKKDVLIVTLVAIISGYLMQMVVSDAISLSIVLIKGMLFPVIIILLYRWVRNLIKKTKKIT